MTEYLCTECERNVEASSVRCDYGLSNVDNFKSKKLYTRTINVKGKHLCICNKCFNNFACEYKLMKKRVIGKLSMYRWR